LALAGRAVRNTMMESPITTIRLMGDSSTEPSPCYARRMGRQVPERKQEPAPRGDALVKVVRMLR